MFKRRRHTLKHTAIHLNGAANDVKLDLFAGVFGRLPHHTVQAVRDTLKFLHPRSQQVPLQVTCLACLRNQIIFSQLNCTLQTTLHRRNVIDRFGHHAGQFLYTGKSIKLQRVKALLRVFGLFHPRLHLSFRMELYIAKLLTKSIQVAGEITQRSTQLP